MATAVADFSALLAAQPPLPISAEMDKTLQDNLFEGRSHTAAGSNHLPHFSPATLQFLKKLSPSLQKAALSAFRKKSKTTPTAKKITKQKKTISYTSSTTTSPTAMPYYTTKPEKKSSTTTTVTSTIFNTPSEKLTTANKVIPSRKQKDYTQKSTPKPKVTPPSFHWGDIESDTHSFWTDDFSGKMDLQASERVNRMGLISPSNSDDAGIVLLVAIFNLLAVVIYAAHRHVTNLPSLPPRVLDWQVQKVLDELVLRVHSSSGAAKVLARALPSGLSVGAFGGRSISLTPKNGLQVLDNAKDFMLSVASSPAARKSATLPSGIYRPFSEIYESVSQDLKNILTHEKGNSSMTPGATGRQLSEEGTDASPMWLQIVLGASELNGVQWDGILRTLTMIGRSRSLLSSEIIAKALIAALSSPAGSARNHGEAYLGNLQSRIKEINEINLAKNGKKQDSNSKRTKRSSIKQQLHYTVKDGSRVMLQKGLVDDAPSLMGAGGEVGPLWAQRWFSLVTRLAPVALDATTLYARAHREPTCLRSLLCSINFSWKKVGPLQAALTPLLSVLTGWALEERMPHPLGESLEAIRSGWLGRNCAVLYPECTITLAPDNIVRQALTYFSRLEFSLNENTTTDTFEERSSLDNDNEIILLEDKKVFAPTPSGQLHIHQLHPSKIEHFSSKEVSHETGSHGQDEPYSGSYEEAESQRHDFTDSKTEGIYQPQHDLNDERTAQSRFRTPENQEDMNSIKNTNVEVMYVAEQVDQKPLEDDSYELYRKETYGPYVRATGHVRNSNDYSTHEQRTADLSLIHRMSENEVEHHEQDTQDNEPQWHREALETRSTQDLPSSVPSPAPLYMRYDSRPPSSEEHLEHHSVIAGMDLQDAQLSRAEALTSDGGFADANRAEPVSESRSSSTAPPAESFQRQKERVVYVHHIDRPTPELAQKVNLADASSSRPVSRFALQNHKNVYSSSNFEHSDRVESKLRVQQSSPSNRWREMAAHDSRYHAGNFGERPRKKLRNYFNIAKARPILPKSRYLFRSSHDSNSHVSENVDKSNQRKVLFSPAHKKDETHDEIDISRAVTLHQQRKNSKRPLEFNSTKKPSGQRPNHSQHSRNLSVESSIRFSNDNEYMKRGEVLPSDAKRNDNTEPFSKKSRRKYMYGLRRGLPAITVENYSLSEDGNSQTFHLRQRTRPWFTYSSKKNLQSSHKNFKKLQHPISFTEKPVDERPVEEFGPNDAITDEFKHILLYQYIRDQVKEKPNNPEEVSEDKQDPKVSE